jgi:hypothetical protein
MVMATIIPHGFDLTVLCNYANFADRESAWRDAALTEPCYVAFVPKHSSAQPKPTNPYRGEVVFYFEVVDGRAREIDLAESHVEHRGQLQVWLTLASINNRLRCVGVDVRSYVKPLGETPEQRVAPEPFPWRDGFTEIGSAVWRSIPIGALIERAIAERKDDYQWLAEAARGGDLDYRGQDREEVASRYESLIGESDKPRRGPRRLLSLDDLTEVVAPAYNEAGNKPVVAVRDALSKHRGQAVSMDQARKAVVRARAVGALPPASRRGKP